VEARVRQKTINLRITNILDIIDRYINRYIGE
jgi:hypothetical protein